MITYTHIGQDIEEAVRHAKRTQREYEKAREKYLQILKGRGGNIPGEVSVAVIYQHSRWEFTKAKARLRYLRKLQADRHLVEVGSR